MRLTDGSTQPYTYMVWVYFANYPTMYRGREELYREIHYALKRAGIGPATEIQEWRTRRAEIPNAEPPTIYLALKSLDLADHYAAIVKQRLAEAELMGGKNEAQHVSNTTQHVKRIIKKLIR